MTRASHWRRRRAPQDLERIDARLVRFWEQYGTAIDLALIMIFGMCCAWCVGYLVGQAAR